MISRVVQSPRSRRGAGVMLALALALVPAALAAQGAPPGGMPPPGRPMKPPKPPKPLKRDAVIAAVRDQHRAADADADGYLTLAEVRGQIRAATEAAMRRRFAAIDADRNGTIDLGEFVAWQDTLAGRAGSGMRGELVPEILVFDPGKGDSALVLRMLIEPVGATAVVQADANADGRVDASEWEQHQLRKFDRLDADGDGLLDAGELPPPGAGGMPGEGTAMPPPPGAGMAPRAPG